MQPYNLLACPLCGCNILEEHENGDRQATAIYCTECPYGVEDCIKTLEELRACHNKRELPNNEDEYPVKKQTMPMNLRAYSDFQNHILVRIGGKISGMDIITATRLLRDLRIAVESAAGFDGDMESDK